MFALVVLHPCFSLFFQQATTEEAEREEGPDDEGQADQGMAAEIDDNARHLG
jgi:hypothetical protein